MLGLPRGLHAWPAPNQPPTSVQEGKHRAARQAATPARRAEVPGRGQREAPGAAGLAAGRSCRDQSPSGPSAAIHCPPVARGGSKAGLRVAKTPLDLYGPAVCPHAYGLPPTWSAPAMITPGRQAKRKHGAFVWLPLVSSSFAAAACLAELQRPNKAHGVRTAAKNKFLLACAVQRTVHAQRCLVARSCRHRRPARSLFRARHPSN